MNMNQCRKVNLEGLQVHNLDESFYEKDREFSHWSLDKLHIGKYENYKLPRVDIRFSRRTMRNLES